MRYPDCIKMEELNLEKFSWIDMDEFEMQLIEFQNSSFWKQKFIDVRVHRGIAQSVRASAMHAVD